MVIGCLPALTTGYGFVLFFMFLSFYRRLSDCLVRAEGTP